MARIDRVELLSGLLILVMGAFFFFGAQEYRMGTVQRMGPGFVPFWLGAIAMLLGVLILIGGINRSSETPRIRFRVVVPVLGSILAFAFLLPRTGLVVATFVTTVISMTAETDIRWRLVLMAAVAISAICWTIFIFFLGLPIPDFRWRF